MTENKTIEEKLDVIIQHLSSINYLLLYGDKVTKDSHYAELQRRIGNTTTSIQELHQ
jgi:hypothetical protein